MRKFLLTIFLVSACVAMKAQDYRIESVIPTSEMAARENIKLDFKERQCAVFRIATQNITPEMREGFHFESDYGSNVADRQIVGGEIWLWVSPGIKTLKIFHDVLGNIELHTSNYGIKVESLFTYKVAIKGTMAPDTNKKPEITQQYLAFQISPSNATLEVNGEKWEVGKDGSAMKYVPFGSYSYRIQALDYHPIEGTVFVNDARSTKKVPVNLSPNFGWVEVSALGNLQDASVYIDDIFLGKAPYKSKAMKSGSHKIRITKELYDTFDTTFIVNDNETTILSPILKTYFNEVTLSVDADAEIWVNGQKKGIRIWRGPLDNGTYTIECKQEGCETTSLTQEIDADTFRNAIELPIPQPVYGSLSIESTPSFAEVFLDDKVIGETPIFVPDISVGKHELRLAKQGYSEYSERIDISKDKSTQIQVSLNNSFGVWFGCNIENARLTIDDQYVGNASGIYELTVGKHKILATAYGYQDYKRTIEVGEDKTNFTIIMRSLSPELMVNGIPLNMKWIGGGTFQMGLLPGKNNETINEQTASVTLSNYCISETEVTQALWNAVMDSNPSINVGDDKPVENVSWNDCQEFIRKLNQITGKNFRLPTEAEWEFAARGGNDGESWIYSGSNEINDVAWYVGNSNNSTSPVKRKKPNNLGLYDMSGNVYEWCNDWFGDYDYNPQTDPQGPSSGKNRVVRGGGYQNSEGQCHVTKRQQGDPEKSSSSVGFRLALSE